VAFANVQKEKKIVDRKKVRCYNCQEMGHYSNECTNDKKERADEDGTINVTIGADGNECDDVIIGADGSEYDDVNDFTFVNHSVEPGKERSGADLQEYNANLEEYDVVADDEYIFHQAATHVNPTWILLDSQSTTYIFSNASLFPDIHESGKIINIHCNAGTRRVTKVGTLRNYREVWYNANAIANLFVPLSSEGALPVKYDSTNGNKFVVIQPTKEVLSSESVRTIIPCHRESCRGDGQHCCREW
jgi:hypothetical protein